MNAESLKLNFRALGFVRGGFMYFALAAAKFKWRRLVPKKLRSVARARWEVRKSHRMRIAKARSFAKLSLPERHRILRKRQ
jgi:hypothetical protein